MKSTELRQLVVAMGMLGSLAVSGQAMASPIEQEVDTTGVIGAVDFKYGDHTINAEIARSTELDSYLFSGVAGDNIRILLNAGGGLDPRVALFSPTGVELPTTISCNHGCSAVSDHELEETGQFTITVSDGGVDEGGSYEMHLERYPPVNNWRGIQYQTPENEVIGHSTDMDYFGFNGVANTKVRVAVDAFGGLDPRMEIWSPNGTLLEFDCNHGCSLAPTIEIEATGIYKVGLFDGGLDEGGNYRLEVNCAFGFGSCPSPLDAAPIPGVPEPETYALMLAGLGLVGFAARRRKTA